MLNFSMIGVLIVTTIPPKDNLHIAHTTTHHSLGMGVGVGEGWGRCVIPGLLPVTSFLSHRSLTEQMAEKF